MKAVLDWASVLPNLFWVKGRCLAPNVLLRGAVNPRTQRPRPGRYGHSPTKLRLSPVSPQASLSALDQPTKHRLSYAFPGPCVLFPGK